MTLEQHNEQVDPTAFLLTLGTIFLAVIGVFLVIFSLTYIQDLQTLQDVPNMVWSMVCGQPTESGVALPLMITLSLLAFLASGVLYGVRWWIVRKEKQS